jgi:hypothetical protein
MSAQRKFSEPVKKKERLTGARLKPKEPQLGLGRYERVRDARIPATHPAPPLGMRTAIVGVPDPYDKVRTQAVVNRDTDVLERERSSGRLSEAAYRVGCVIKAVYERARGPSGGGQWLESSHSDPWTAHEWAIIKGLENAHQITAMHRHIVDAVGIVGAMQLRSALVEGLTFQQMARGERNRRDAEAAARRFRWMLEDIADRWAATGRARHGVLAHLTHTPECA